LCVGGGEVAQFQQTQHGRRTFLTSFPSFFVLLFLLIRQIWEVPHNITEPVYISIHKHPCYNTKFIQSKFKTTSLSSSAGHTQPQSISCFTFLSSGYWIWRLDMAHGRLWSDDWNKGGRGTVMGKG